MSGDVAGFASGLDWSPDGTRLALGVLLGLPGDFPFRLVICPLASSCEGTVAAPARQGPWSHLDPAWSPDGSALAYGHDGSICLARPDGSEAGRLAYGDGTPTWNPAFPAPESGPLGACGPVRTVVTTAPPPTTTSTTATIAFDSSEPGGDPRCALDDQYARSCRSPAVYTDLAPGLHTLSVQTWFANDSVSVEIGDPVTISWTVVAPTPAHPSVAAPVRPAAPAHPAAPVRCRVPRLRGLTARQAGRRLGAAHCRLGRIRRISSRSGRHGRVVRQRPAAGRLVARGTRVALALRR